MQQIAEKKKLCIPSLKETYNGNLSSFAADVSNLSNCSIFKLRSILKYHNLNYGGTKDELIMRVFLLRPKRSYLILESTINKLVKGAEKAVSIIIWQRKHHNRLNHIYRQRKFSYIKKNCTNSQVKVSEHCLNGWILVCT